MIKPGWGFIMGVGTYLCLALFLVWGMCQPELEKIWEVEQTLKQGKPLPDKQKAALLWKTFELYPEYANAFAKKSSVQILGQDKYQGTSKDLLLLRRNKTTRLYLKNINKSFLLEMELYSKQTTQGKPFIIEVKPAAQYKVKLPELQNHFDLLQIRSPQLIKWEVSQ